MIGILLEGAAAQEEEEGGKINKLNCY